MDIESNSVSSGENDDAAVHVAREWNVLKVVSNGLPWWKDPKFLPPGAPGSYWELGPEEEQNE